MKMNKNVVRIAKWVIASIIIQVLVLCIANYIYLPVRGKVFSTVLNTGIVTNVNGYYAYSEGETLVVGQTKPFIIKKIIKQPSQIPAFYKWVEDRDILIYTFKDKSGEASSVQIKTYDLTTNIVKPFPIIRDLPKGSVVYNIDASPYTNMVYIQITSSKNGDFLYKYDILDELELVLKLQKGKQFKVLKYENKLLYEKDSDIYIYDGLNKTSKLLYENKKLVMLKE